MLNILWIGNAISQLLMLFIWWIWNTILQWCLCVFVCRFFSSCFLCVLDFIHLLNIWNAISQWFLLPQFPNIVSRSAEAIFVQTWKHKIFQTTNIASDEIKMLFIHTKMKKQEVIFLPLQIYNLLGLHIHQSDMIRSNAIGTINRKTQISSTVDCKHFYSPQILVVHHPSNTGNNIFCNIPPAWHRFTGYERPLFFAHHILLFISICCILLNMPASQKFHRQNFYHHLVSSRLLPPHAHFGNDPLPSLVLPFCGDFAKRYKFGTHCNTLWGALGFWQKHEYIVQMASEPSLTSK